ncbi:hypothetical protein CALVIDRAFT_83199 [Calocera viscosa TUFC12733]|uniref:Essential protein Yae1 N-terminal domain-containing protein n=1 Tax=Calocera viscosa (strain TUFC12733) TaxID=1330018 RepID=A0A167N3D5_CALVF|nr:hypothetical protein CALVIDRAFT_83199 [Calocera viscosa TUFC12733]
MDMELDTEQPIAGPSNPVHGAHARTVHVSFDLDDLSNLEQQYALSFLSPPLPLTHILSCSFYDTGYADGLSHGRIHGLIEGRELGREKGFELWEEVGFYEGFARTWSALLDKGGVGGLGGGETARPRALQSLTRLLALVERFPTTNPTPSSEPASSTPEHEAEADAESAAHGGDTPPENADMTALLARTRAQYRTLCSTLGVRPRMAVAQNAGAELGRKLAF